MSEEQEEAVPRVDAIGDNNGLDVAVREALDRDAFYRGRDSTTPPCAFCKAAVVIPFTMTAGCCPQCDLTFRRGDLSKRDRNGIPNDYMTVYWDDVKALPRWAQKSIEDYKQLYVAEHLRACRRQTEVTAAVLTLEFIGQRLDDARDALKVQAATYAASEALLDIALSTDTGAPGLMGARPRRHDIDLLPYIDRISSPKPGELPEGWGDGDGLHSRRD